MYTFVGLKKRLQKETELFRIEYVLKNFNEEEKKVLQENCPHDNLVDRNTKGWSCWHELWCSDCGTLVREYDSSG